MSTLEQSPRPTILPDIRLDEDNFVELDQIPRQECTASILWDKLVGNLVVVVEIPQAGESYAVSMPKVDKAEQKEQIDKIREHPTLVLDDAGINTELLFRGHEAA